MYLLVCLTILSGALAIPITTNTVQDRSLYVLPGDTYPTSYDVRLFLDPANTDYFFGNVSIRIIPNIATNIITMHAMEMTIDNVQVFSTRENSSDIFFSTSRLYDDTHLLRIQVTEPLVPLVPYEIHISYTGQYAANMFGIYVSTYQQNGVNVPLVTSQLQPTFARRAFPCYDEPALKAIFRTTIYAPEQYEVVRSNTNLRNNTLQPEVPNWKKHEFEDTLVMSTYLIAYLVSNFEYISNENDVNPPYHVPFRVYSRPDTQAFADFALDFGQKNMDALEKYTEFPYLFPKMDKAAVPDFAAGAMENWGLVIYREAALLVQDGVTTTSVRQNIGRIICHENMHQWFGNEVGPLSWTYTWLNEGFANFFENYATDLVLPEWQMMDQFVIALQNVFQSDAVLSINPMTHPVYTPSEILGTFNAVAYQKSGSVIRMMQHFMTPEVFRKGLVIYIKNLSRRAAGPDDLYVSLQQALDESDHSIPYNMTNAMVPWVNQGGFPIITVRRLAPSANSISIEQARYLTDNTLQANNRWPIPVNWVLSTNPDFTDTRPQGWVPPTNRAESFDIPGLTAAEWFIVNKQQTGYYRVNYEVENWVALANQLNTSHQTIHHLNRAQLLDDVFNVARNGRLNYKYALDLSRYLEKEKDYIPWAAVNPAFNYLDLALVGSDEYETFKEYLLIITAPLYAELGFQAAAGEAHVTPYFRNIILDINCRQGNQDCIDTATQLLQSIKNNPAQRLNPDIQNIVFCSGLRGGDVDNFNFLWSQYAASTDSTEQSILLSAMGCTTNEERRTFYLNEVINDNSPVRQQDKHTIIVSVINASPEGMEAALDFCSEHWDQIQPRVQGLTGTTNILNAFARRLTTQAQSEKIERFANRHQNVFTAGELAAIGAIRENIRASITWSDVNAEIVENWLRETFKSSASALSASILVIVSFIVAFLQH